MPAAKRGKAHKFARPFCGPYRIVDLFNNGAEVQLIAKPQADNIRVAFNRIRRCPDEILESLDQDRPAESKPDEPSRPEPGEPNKQDTEGESERVPPEATRETTGVWKSRLRPDTSQARMLTLRAGKCNILPLDC